MSDIAQDTILRIAKLADAISMQAGVGGVETAGQVVSYLAAHPEQINAVLEGGICDLPDDWFGSGCLSWHAVNGKVVSPAFYRRSKTIAALKEPQP